MGQTSPEAGVADAAGAGSSPALRVTISGNRPRCGYVSCLTTQVFWERIVSSHEEASGQGPGLALGPAHPVGDEPGERSVRATTAPTVNALWPGPQQ
jgi:hypothetical protein